MSIMSGKAIIEAREVISNFFNINNSMQLCFTKNATEALNIAIRGILKEKDHVITTCMEHNSVMRPLKALEKELGIEISQIKGDEFGEADPDDIKKCIKSNTKLIISTLSSNVNGIVMPIAEIGRISREKGILFLVDASQGAGMLKVDVEAMNIDLLAFPGHKGLLGPQGTGCLYVKEGVTLKPLMQGGTGSNSENIYQPDIMPDLSESGTINTPGIIGLGYGVGFINSFGLENIKEYKYSLVNRMFEGINDIKNIKLYSRVEKEKNSGIIALNFNDIDSSEISYILDKVYGIATRAGLHCAPAAHETLGTLRTGIVRFSIGCFNTIDEVDITIQALREISQNL
jgi:cysteine desulfurase / selenocysteine lyase